MQPARIFDDGVADGADAGRPIEQHRVELVRCGHQRGHLPVGKMGGEEQRRLVPVAHCHEPVGRLFVEHDISRPGPLDVEHAKRVEVGELRGDTAEIVP